MLFCKPLVDVADLKGFSRSSRFQSSVVHRINVLSQMTIDRPTRLSFVRYIRVIYIRSAQFKAHWPTVLVSRAHCLQLGLHFERYLYSHLSFLRNSEPLQPVRELGHWVSSVFVFWLAVIRSFGPCHSPEACWQVRGWPTPLSHGS